MVYNTQKYSEQFDVPLLEISARWAKVSKVIRLATSIYVAELEKGAFVINGFWPGLRESYLSGGVSSPAEGQNVHYFVVKFDPRELSWRDFRSRVIGNADPSLAESTSIRGSLYDAWQEVGLPCQPKTSSNAIYASAGPLSALRDRKKWTGVLVENDPYGQALLSAGVSSNLLQHWLKSCNIFVYWRYDTESPVSGYLFDITANRDSAEVLMQLKQAALEPIHAGFLPEPLRHPYNLTGQHHLWKAFPMQRWKSADLIKKLEQIDILKLVNLLKTELPYLEDAALPPTTINVFKKDIVHRHPKYRSDGLEAIRKGNTAVCILAAATGSRLNFDGPLVLYHSTLPSGKCLLQIAFEKIAKASRLADFGDNDTLSSSARSTEEGERGWGSSNADMSYEPAKSIPVVILTSPLTHKAILNNLEENKYYGVEPTVVRLVQQGVTPLFDHPDTRKLVLDSSGSPKFVPSGKGLCLKN